MPYLQESLLDSVVFIYKNAGDAADGVETGATAFLLTEPSPDPAIALDRGYLVTNAHVVESRDSLTARINLRAGGFTCVEIPRQEWSSHPSGDDVAVVPLSSLPAEDWQGMALRGIESSFLLDASDPVVGVGDEVVIIGRQYRLDGRLRNTPAVRFGNISMMSPEPVYQAARNHYQESIVVEARSLGGFSGSPVFAFRSSAMGPPEMTQSLFGSDDASPTHGDDLVHAEWPLVVGPMLETPVCLLGVNWGHMDAHGARTAPGLALTHAERDLSMNSGMALLTPASKLRELLDLPRFSVTR